MTSASIDLSLTDRKFYHILFMLISVSWFLMALSLSSHQIRSPRRDPRCRTVRFPYFFSIWRQFIQSNKNRKPNVSRYFFLIHIAIANISVVYQFLMTKIDESTVMNKCLLAAMHMIQPEISHRCKSMMSCSTTCQYGYVYDTNNLCTKCQCKSDPCTVRILQSRWVKAWGELGEE